MIAGVAVNHCGRVPGRDRDSSVLCRGWHALSYTTGALEQLIVLLSLSLCSMCAPDPLQS